LFGLFFPVSVPTWFTTMFMFWQTFVTICAIGFIIDSIWSG
jgi:hypothetical protein